MRTIKRHSIPIFILLVSAVVVALLLVPGLRKGRRAGYSNYLPLPMTANAAETSPWTQAISRIKEDRGEPAGKQAKIDIPSQLRHYADTRRFLAVQVAEVREHAIKTPQDMVELAELVNRNELIAVQQVTEDYILFGVGGSADKSPFTRYENGASVPLFNELGLRQEYSRIAESRTQTEAEIAGLRKQIKALTKRERAQRSALQSQLNASEQKLKAASADKELLDRHYSDTASKTALFNSYDELAKLGRSFPARDYNLDDPNSRRELKVRLLSAMRPEAFKVMEEIASNYRQQFGRPLPITSLVRPDEYQLQLSKTNPNATRIETPPHSTGLAFDVFYGYMTAAEQTFVMDQLARMKDEGRIEVLRENRNHYHVFAFVDGRRPGETLIAAALGDRKPTVQETHHATVETHHAKIVNKSQKQPAKKQKKSGRRRR